MGTPPYWAPEVLKHHPSDTRSDIWSFGVLLYEMASGQMPFKGATIIELGSAILQALLCRCPNMCRSRSRRSPIAACAKRSANATSMPAKYGLRWRRSSRTTVAANSTTPSA